MKHKFFIISFAVVIVVQLLLSFQGFDLCDEGFSLTFYQQFYNDPASVEYNFVYWLSGLIGGLWYELFPEGGILWFRLLAVVCNSLTFFLGYKILHRYLGVKWTVIGLTMALFANNFGFLVFYHNQLTALMALWAICLMQKGLLQGKNRLLLFAGVILGVNIFTRIPNLTLLGFVGVVPLYFWGKEWFKNSVFPILYFAFGNILGIGLVFLILASLGQVEIMFGALESLFYLGSQSDSGHNSGALINVFLGNHITTFVLGCVLLVVCFGFTSVFSWFEKQKTVLISILVFAFLLFCYLHHKHWIFVLYAMGYLGAVFFLFFKDKDYRLLGAFSFLLLFFMPLGSGGAIKSSGYMGVWLAVPVFLYGLSQIKSLSLIATALHEHFQVTVGEKSLKMLLNLVVLSFFVVKTWAVLNEAYFDEGSRFKKTETVNSVFARGILTTTERAKVVNDLLPHLNKYVTKDDYLFTYDNAPMLHFLTETKPYMYNPWVWIYDEKSFKFRLEEAENSRPELPIVVQQKFNTIKTFSEPIDNYMAVTDDNPYLYSKNRTLMMNAFLKRNHYEIVWQNAYFNIYKAATN
ncbi:MAG TPA: hypothetical protein VKZ97_01700 [Flavobacteriaceae bacterium]|nr:hypothetical protein [Flavobacteriaceae bacterium]